jgi:hypothetical protein
MIIAEFNSNTTGVTSETGNADPGVIRSRKLKKGWQHIVQKENDKSTKQWSTKHDTKKLKIEYHEPS